MNLKTTIAAILLLLMLTPIASIAQPARGERVHAIKVAYLTDKMNLTTKQSEGFWSVYNRYEEEAKGIREKYLGDFKQKRQSGMSAEEAMRSVEDNLDFQEATIALKRKYNDSFLKIISAQQLAALYDAEREFKIMLLKRMQQRRGGRR